ncbi:MAG: GIY-YIG nuclease family protein [Rubrivivax sp.]
MKPFFVYMLRCADGSYYVGHTDELERRIAQHRAGEIPGYTHERRPVELVWSQEAATREEALAAERQVKGWLHRSASASAAPGARSTFIEALGLHLLDGLADRGRVAVLAVDPSSSPSGGSILGDKTRMERLAVARASHPPQPSVGNLGGVAEKTREAMLVVGAAAGYDIVIVETVGVGQSETAVAGMTDMETVLLVLFVAGDDLQAIKRGITEIADLVVINKEDLDPAAATRARAQITRARCGSSTAGQPGRMRGTAHWQPQVLTLSALKGTGVAEFWQAVQRYRDVALAGGALERRRHAQDEAWMWERIDAGLRQRFRDSAAVRAALPGFTEQVRAGTLAASVAARRLLDLFG